MPAKNFGIQATGCCRALMSLCKAAKIDFKLPIPAQNERKNLPKRLVQFFGCRRYLSRYGKHELFVNHAYVSSPNFLTCCSDFTAKSKAISFYEMLSEVF